MTSTRARATTRRVRGARPGAPRIGDHELVRRLGSGAQGDSYLARPADRLDTPAEYIVVKVHRRPLAGGAFDRAVEAAGVAASAAPLHVAKVLELLRVDNQLAVVVEHEPGGSLAGPAQPLRRGDVLAAVADAALGAHALHEVGMVHGAIKPTNVLLGARHARLVDLALAASMEPGLTLAGAAALSSADLVDPAVLLGTAPSRASDVWALGATLHRALTGRSLFGVVPDLDSVGALAHLTTTEVRLGADLTPGEARVIAECVAEDPLDRPPTALALAELLDALVAPHEP